MGVSKNSGTPKWMVKIMVPNPMNKWMIWGGIFHPLFFGSTPIWPILERCGRFSAFAPRIFFGMVRHFARGPYATAERTSVDSVEQFSEQMLTMAFGVFFWGGRNDVCFMTKVMCFFFVCVANVHTV